MPQKIKAFVSQTPQKFYQRTKIPKLSLIVVALLAGAIGTYALIHSLAATPCTLDLDHTTVSSGCPVVRTDTGTITDAAGVRPVWGNLQCADASRFQQFTTGGDPHNTANGTPQGNNSYYKMTILNGDNFYNSRCELGQNERRYGEDGGDGTFQLYQQGEHKITFMSIRLPSNFQTNVNAWQTIMQMKQTEPDNTAYSSPILEMQAYDGLFRINSDPAGTLWTTSLVAGQWVRFAFDVTYSQNNSEGKIKVYVDKNGDGDTLDPGEQSPVITTATLGTQTQTSIGPGPTLYAGNPVPGHLRLGLYHNPSYDCPAPTGCSTDDDNVQVVDLTDVTVGTTPPPDTTAPTVSLTAPASGVTVSGSNATVSANASDDTGVAGVQFKLDGNNLGSEDTTAPYTTNWDTTTATNGTHTLTAVARDAAGNTKTSSSVNVTVNNSTTVAGCTDVLNPGGNLQTFLNSLQAGDTGCVRAGSYGARGTIYTFASNGTGSNPVTLKDYPGDAKPTILGQFRVTGSYQTVSGFVFDGPTGILPSGAQDVQVWLNGSNNTIFSNNEVRNNDWHAGIFVSGVTNAQILRSYIHDNGQFTDPTMANLDHGIYWYSGSGVIANNIIEHNYAYGIQLYSAPNNVRVVNNTIVGQTGRGGIIIGESAANSVIANNIISGNGFGINVYSVTGTNNIATNNLFWNNSGGNITGGNGLTVTNSISGNPLFAGTNDYRLTAGSPTIDKANSNYVASPDYAGTVRPQGSASDIGAYEFTGSSTPPTDTTAPTVSFTSPTNGSTVSGIVTATASASDDTGVTKVDLSLDGSLKMTDTTAPYNYSFDSKTLGNGNHTLTAKAYDAAGNTSTATITVNVNNPDITPPNAPANLNATATSPTNVNLTWNAATDTGSNPTGVAKYNVLRNSVVIAQPTTNSYTDTTATANTTYSYSIQAIDGAGNVSNNSNTDSVTTPGAVDTAPPTTPTNLKAANAAVGQVNLTWNASTDTGGSGLAGYNVYRNGTKLNTTPVTTTSYGDVTVADNTTYSYKIEAIDGAGNMSAQTSPVSITTPVAIRGDITGPNGVPDGSIDLPDVSYVIRNYNTTNGNADITGPNGQADGKVDLYDLSYIIRNYGK